MFDYDLAHEGMRSATSSTPSVSRAPLPYCEYNDDICAALSAAYLDPNGSQLVGQRGIAAPSNRSRSSRESAGSIDSSCLSALPQHEVALPTQLEGANLQVSQPSTYCEAVARTWKERTCKVQACNARNYNVLSCEAQTCTAHSFRNYNAGSFALDAGRTR
jgi:hypothetical protein